MRQALKYGFGLIAVYLIVANATGFGQAVTAVGKTGSRITRDLQGRN